MVLGSKREQAEQVAGTKAVSSMPPWLLSPSSCSVRVPILTSFSDELWGRSVSQINPSSPTCFWSRCFMTATVTPTKTVIFYYTTMLCSGNCNSTWLCCQSTRVMKPIRSMSLEERAGCLRYCFGAGKEASHVTLKPWKGFQACTVVLERDKWKLIPRAFKEHISSYFKW